MDEIKTNITNKIVFVYKVNNTVNIYNPGIDDSLKLVQQVINLNTVKRNMAMYCERVNEGNPSIRYSIGETSKTYNAFELLDIILKLTLVHDYVPAIDIVKLNLDGQDFEPPQVDGNMDEVHEEERLEERPEKIDIPVDAPKKKSVDVPKKKKKKKSN